MTVVVSQAERAQSERRLFAILLSLYCVALHLRLLERLDRGEETLLKLAKLVFE